MVWDYRGDCTLGCTFLNDNMAAFLTDDLESVMSEGFDQVACGNDRQASHCLDSDFKCRQVRRFREVGDFLGIGGFQKELNRFSQVFLRFFDGLALAGDIQLGTRGYIPVPLVIDDGRKRVDHVYPLLIVSGARRNFYD